jgi:TP901-1 family phage major tail protein
MSAQKGKELLLQVNNGSGTYETVGGFTSNDFDINGQAVDITNKDSAGFKEALSGGGIVSINTSASGVFMNDESFERVHDAALANTHLDCRICVPNFMAYTGPFIVTSLGMNGATEDAVQYSISLESAGAITATPLVGGHA